MLSFSVGVNWILNSCQSFCFVFKKRECAHGFYESPVLKRIMLMFCRESPSPPSWLRRREPGWRPTPWRCTLLRKCSSVHTARCVTVTSQGIDMTRHEAGELAHSSPRVWNPAAWRGHIGSSVGLLQALCTPSKMPANHGQGEQYGLWVGARERSTGCRSLTPILPLMKFQQSSCWGLILNL